MCVIKSQKDEETNNSFYFKLEKIRLYNGEVEELFSLGFYKYLRENKGLGIEVGGKNNPYLKTHFPSEDETRSFILTLRKIYRDTDGISFRCLGKYYELLPVPSEYREKYRELRKSLNNYLDSQTYTIYTNNTRDNKLKVQLKEIIHSIC